MHGHCEWCEQRALLTRLISLHPIRLPFEWVCFVCLGLAKSERRWVRSEQWNEWSDADVSSNVAA